MFYTTVILLIVKKILYDLVSERPEIECNRTGDGCLCDAHYSSQPIMLVLEEENEVLCEIFNDEILLETLCERIGFRKILAHVILG